MRHNLSENFDASSYYNVGYQRGKQTALSLTCKSLPRMLFNLSGWGNAIPRRA